MVLIFTAVLVQDGRPSRPGGCSATQEKRRGGGEGNRLHSAAFTRNGWASGEGEGDDVEG